MESEGVQGLKGLVHGDRAHSLWKPDLGWLPIDTVKAGKLN